MALDGGRLKAHKARQEDFRRRKDNRLKGNAIIRSKKTDKVNFDEVDPIELEKIKSEIRNKAGKKRTIETLLLIISSIIALILFYWFVNRYG